MVTAPRHNTVRRGVTLIEMLIVVGIILLLATITIPALGPMAQSRRVREGARAVNVFVGSTRLRAIETGRPAGVVFERLPHQPQACVTLRKAEVPLPFTGDMEDAVIQVQDWTYSGDPNENWAQNSGQGLTVIPEGWVQGDPLWYYADGPRILKVRVQDFDFSPGLIRHGDLMQINYQGPWYTIEFDGFANSDSVADDFMPPDPPAHDFPVETDQASYNYGYIDFDPQDKTYISDQGHTWVANYQLTLRLARETLPLNFRIDKSPFPSRKDGNNWSVPLPFTILRRPMPSPAAPLQLPRGAVVDLAASGTDQMLPQVFDAPTVGPPNPVVITFSPTGAVDWVYYSDPATGAYGPHRVTGPVHLLVGKWERMPVSAGGPAPAGDGFYNWQDSSNLWVALNPHTGLVTVAEPYADQLDQSTNTYIPSGQNFTERMFNSRQVARQAQISKGGR